MGNMNSDDRPSIAGEGIALRGDPVRDNPIGDWNQVRVVYCSSDAWTGTRRDVPLEAVHPKTGAPVSYAINFLGRRIFDAAIATLRRDGVGALTWDFGQAPRTMPDLDDASEVILSGDSAGGSGVISNLDYLATTLRANNSHCTGASCDLVVRGLMDAIVGPDLARLDYSTSVWAAFGGTTYDLFMQYVSTVPDVTQGAVSDASCREWHAANEPGTAARCSDISHVVRNHVTTPFFVRMALLDGLISGNYIEALYRDPELGLLNLQKFAVILQRELALFPELTTSAEEGDAMSVAAGVFAPACTKHDTIHTNAEVFGVSITPPDGSPLTLFDVFENWRAGRDPAAVLTSSPIREDTVCPN
jgi:hypothetical protein